MMLPQFIAGATTSKASLQEAAADHYRAVTRSPIAEAKSRL